MTDIKRNDPDGPAHSSEARRGKRPAQGPQQAPLATDSLDALLADSSERDLLVKRYLLGHLSEDEVEAFEKRFVHDQTLLDELDEAERFIDGFRQLEREGRLQGLAESRGLFLRGGGGSPSWPFRIACAGAVLVAVIAAAYFYNELHGVRRELALVNAPQVNTQIVDLEVTRGASAANEPIRSVRLPAQPGWIVLAMDTGSTDAVERRARLMDSSDKVVAESTGLRADDLGIVYWSIHSSSLREGDYVAQVGAAVTASTPEVRYPFRVLARG
jgi:hypothetical protein